MSPKTKTGSKIPTSQTGTNKKRANDFTQSSKGFDTSLIKRNEFALIIVGALFLTAVVFFLFFRSSSSKTVEMQVPQAVPSYADLEKRILSLENTISKTGGDAEKGQMQNDAAQVDLLAKRVARLETAFSAKFDSVIDRMAGMEKTIAQLKQPVKAPAVKVAAKTSAPKPTVKKSAAEPPVKKSLKKSELFHTVKKGETLYSISKKYNTTVKELRKLNNLSENAKIYVGNNLLVR